MALPDTFPFTTPTNRSTGISAQAIAAGANYLGSEIDNSANLDTLCDIEVDYTPGVGPTAGDYIEAYLVYAQDGTNYEDGDATPTDPVKASVGIVRCFTDTTRRRFLISGVPLSQFKFKVLLKSEVAQSITVNAVTLKSYRLQVTDT